MTTQNCYICTQSYEGFGNNPEPVRIKTKNPKKTDYRCCDECNLTVVLPVRLGIWGDRKKTDEFVEHIRSQMTEAQAAHQNK